MPREPIPTWFYVLVAVRKEDRFLVVHEASRGQLWYLPAGRVEAEERLEDAACRETLEESGLNIELTGIVRVEHSVMPYGARVRVIFTARPADDQPPRHDANEHTLEARWVTLDELAGLPLRGYEVVDIFNHLAYGGTVYPLSLLTDEGAPFLKG
jgi:phosphatase NudJ